MIWFAIGAGLGGLQFALRFGRRILHANHPVQGFIFATVAGAIVYGSILWLIAKLFGY